MYLSFELSMPNVASWNGKWSGEDRFYAIIENFRSKNAIEKAIQIRDKGYFHYNFGDGWSAGISVREVDPKEAAKIRRRSQGFCGYNWMVDSILEDGRIMPKSRRRNLDTCE